jgi:hypothetical protein
MMAGGGRRYWDTNGNVVGPAWSGAGDLDLELLVLGLSVRVVADRSLTDDPVALAFCSHRRLIDAPVAPIDRADPSNQVTAIHGC